MTKITPSRQFIQEEESDFRSSISEGYTFKLGGSVNFINSRQLDERGWFLNGRYDLVSDPQTGVDGLIIIPFDAEIVGVVLYSLVGGTSGTTELDIIRLTQSGFVGPSIFSTTPKVTSAGTDNGYVGIIWDDTSETFTNIAGGTGFTFPNIGATPFQLDQGDALRCDKISSMVAGESCGIVIYMRPR